MNDQLNGKQTAFFSSGNEMLNYNCMNSLKEGVSTLYYDSELRKINGKITYSNDKMNGSISKYFENGKLEYEGQMKDDKKEGVWIYYFDDGREPVKRTYMNGERVN